MAFAPDEEVASPAVVVGVVSVWAATGAANRANTEVQATARIIDRVILNIDVFLRK